MVDPRVKKLADILVNYSIKVKKGDIINVKGGADAKDLLLEVCKLILKKGAAPRLNVGLPGFAYTYYKHAQDNILKQDPKIAMYEAKNCQGVIHIGAEYNTKELTHVDHKKVALRRKHTHKVSEFIVNKQDNWVICEYPTNALAQDAEMSLEEFEDFVYGATNVNWAKEKTRMKKLAEIVNKGKKVRIKAKNTDIFFSIKGKKSKICAGDRNMPDGEVFTEPVKHSVEGHIEYTFPAIYGGVEVDGVKLDFKKGKVVKATAKKNEEYLKKMINIDPGASYLGEFGIGTNYGLKRFVKQILFDEKIGGTIHLALGMAYKETGGENKSALHWDMIKDMRENGELWIDNKLIQKNGKFLIKF
jgi:aminopeptidase